MKRCSRCHTPLKVATMGSHNLNKGRDIEDFTDYLFCPNCNWSDNEDSEYGYYDDESIYKGDKIDPIPI